MVLAGIEKGDQATDFVLDETETSSLRAITEDGERLVPERLHDEGRHDATVLEPHARPVGVEDPDDAGVESVGAVVRHRHRLGEALGLVVDPRGPTGLTLPQ